MTFGTIRKKPSGKYEIRYFISEDGKRKRKSETYASKNVAELRLRDLEYLHSTKDKNIYTVDRFWTERVLPEKKEKLAPSTVAGYESMYNTHIKNSLGRFKLDTVKAIDVQELLDNLTFGAARSTKAVLRIIFTRAYDLELVSRNIMTRHYTMPSKRAVKRSYDVYTEDELNDIFKMINGEIFEPAFILAAFGGASREEAMSVKLGEVKYVSKSSGRFAVIPIQRSVQRLKGEVLILESTKTRLRKRSIIIPQPYSDRLYEITQEKLSLGHVWLTENQFGEVLCPNAMASAYRAWFIGKPYRYIPFSNLRNSYATMMHAKGYDLYFVAHLMGHSQPITTFKHYDRPHIEQLINALDKPTPEA